MDLKNLMFSCPGCIMFWKTTLLFIISLNFYFINMFSVKNVKEGNLFMMNIVYGISMSLGSVIGGVLNKLMNDKIVFVLGLVFIFLANLFTNLIVISMPSLVIIILFSIQVIGVGIVMNCCTIIYSTRNDPKTLVMSLEISFCISSIVAISAKILADDAYLSALTQCIYCLIGMLQILFLDP